MGASDYLAFSARLTSKESERSTATSFVPELTTAEATSTSCVVGRLFARPGQFVRGDGLTVRRSIGN